MAEAAIAVTLVSQIDDPGARLFWAITEQAAKDLAGPPKIAADAADFFHDMAPALEQLGVTAADIEAMIARRAAGDRYSSASACAMFATDGGGARRVRFAAKRWRGE